VKVLAQSLRLRTLSGHKVDLARFGELPQMSGLLLLLR
jgi:hypothetical protein